jgi:hypothetical protein
LRAELLKSLVVRHAGIVLLQTLVLQIAVTLTTVGFVAASSLGWASPALNQVVRVAEGADRVSMHLNDQQGVDRGSLGEVKITRLETTS